MPDKLQMTSKDIIQENIDYIAKRFPNALKEVKNENGKLVKMIDFDILKQELSNVVIDDKQERYQMTWPDKKKSILLANSKINATLRPIKEKSVDFDNTKNLYIEGDNLDVLKLLRETYLNKVKMIYIDPPYNTGNDFVYDDDFVISEEEYISSSGFYDNQGNRLFQNNESNGRFHTDWLNMMYPRLKIARDLLTADGLIFISIDDNELNNLQRICDEIFGEANRVENIIWKNKYGAGAFTVGFISAHEYILCYSKSPITNLTCEFVGEEREKYNKKDEKFAIRGPYRTQPLMTNSLGDRPNLMYSIWHNGVEIKPHKQWVWSKERMEKAIANNDVEFTLQKDGSYSVRSKAYLKDENGVMRRGKPVSVLNGPFTQDGTEEVRNLFDGKSVFDFSKPSELIKFLISLEVNNDNSKDFIVMDFFSGSATTAQAVMKLNASDFGNRKYILVQLPERCAINTNASKAGYNTICDIGEERIRRVANEINEELKKEYESEGLFAEEKTKKKIDVGFRVLKLDSSNMNDVYYNANATSQSLFDNTVDNVKPDRTPLDLLFQVMLELGIELSAKIEEKEVLCKKYFIVNENDIVACFDNNVSNDVIKELAKIKPIYAVFRDSVFENDAANINCEQLFKSISPSTTIKVL